MLVMRDSHNTNQSTSAWFVGPYKIHQGLVSQLIRIHVLSVQGERKVIRLDGKRDISFYTVIRDEILRGLDTTHWESYSSVTENWITWKHFESCRAVRKSENAIYRNEISGKQRNRFLFFLYWNLIWARDSMSRLILLVSRLRELREEHRTDLDVINNILVTNGCKTFLKETLTPSSFFYSAIIRS